MFSTVTQARIASRLLKLLAVILVVSFSLHVSSTADASQGLFLNAQSIATVLAGGVVTFAVSLLLDLFTQIYLNQKRSIELLEQQNKLLMQQVKQRIIREHHP